MKTKNMIVLVASMILATGIRAQAGLDYFLPTGAKLNPAIPTPKSVLGFEIGEYHLTQANIIRYMEALDQASDRITIVRIGQTWEKQNLIQLVITSPANQQNLDKLRKEHLAAIEPGTPSAQGKKDPLILWLGYSVHGNEPSGANAAPVVAYYLAASEDEKILKLLDNAIILLDPCINPDGLNRFASFVNTRKSINNNPDPNSFEFQEPWPGGRSNHYWFDLNRDWLLLQHPETQALISQFHLWKPNVVTDHHEMGSNSTFFFQPGVPTRNNPLTPAGTFSLTQKIGAYHAKVLDQIGSLYYSEEGFDDFYIGKGSSYPDLHGSIGILFEQASSRGHLRQTSNGPLSFQFTIRNQVTVSFSTLDAAMDLKKELQFHMAEFYKSAISEAENSPVKGYIFGDSRDPQKAALLVDNLLKHQIKIYELDKSIDMDGVIFEPGKAWFVPLKQMQYRLIRSVFETVTKFSDSTFYDVSSWTMPLAMGIPYEAVDGKNITRITNTRLVQTVPVFSGNVTPLSSSVGYLISCDPYMLHKGLYQILNQNIRVKIATSSFTIITNGASVTYQPGTLFIPSTNQELNENDLFFTLNKVANENSLTLTGLQTGYSIEGPDLGSSRFADISKPRILTFAGSGNSGITGEIWHLLDTRFQIPMTIAEVRRFSSVDLDHYNILIMSGSYSELDAAALDRIKEWTRKGGVIIGIDSGCNFLDRSGLCKLSVIAPPPQEQKEAGLRPYARRSVDGAGRSIPGTIFAAALDTTHPLAYGYHPGQIAVFKEGNTFFKTSTDPYENLAVFTSSPLLSGYINKENLNLVKNSSAIQRQSFGSGKVILFTDDPLFRGYWAGMHKLFLNSLFWGKI